MRRYQIIGYTLVGLAAAALVGQSAASAQDAPDTTAVDPAGAKQVNLSTADQVSAAEGYLRNMETTRESIRRDLEDARQQRDVVKTLCLNDKLNQLDVAIRSATDRKRGLDLAASRGDADLANHEFTILSVLFQRGQQLDAEAKQCIGKEVGFVGESSTTVDIDPNLPFEDPTDLPDPVVIAQPPNCASCNR
ncbi:MAG TPA: hypothetical protein ENK57_07905 [Polyangiaceae bacterium]|nr:hypothetical protein [Polyangiaceae bacterium]